MLLNPDTIVNPGSLDILIRFLDNNPNVAACGPKLLNENGSVQASVRRFPTFRGMLYKYTVCKSFGFFKSQYRKYMMKNFDYNKQADVDQIMGAAMMVRNSVIEEVGRLDEDFFMYFEEVDWCYRMREYGWRIVFLPDAVITHLGGRSTSQIPLKRKIMMLTSLLIFFRKHRRVFSTFVFTVAFKFALILRNVCHLVAGMFTYILAAIVMNRKRREKTAKKINLNFLLLSKYLWRIIKM